MSYMDFTEHPAYQRAVQRLGRIRPEQRAVMNTLSVDASFADENTRKMLASLSQAQNLNFANRSLGIRERGQATDMGLRRDVFDYNRNQDRMATGIGVGQVAAEYDFGKRRDDIELATLKKKMGFMDRLEALYGGAK